jgi:hypothetical protein
MSKQDDDVYQAERIIDHKLQKVCFRHSKSVVFLSILKRERDFAKVSGRLMSLTVSDRF